MDNAIITLDKVTKVYDGQKAVNELSLQIQKGEVFGLLGPNGAGKSTTILMMLGLIEPTSGTIRIKGIDPVRQPIEVKKIVGYLPDHPGFYTHMTGYENLLYTGALNGYPREKAEKLAAELLEQVGLAEAAHKKTGKYSRGMKQRLGIADVLMKEPEIIILDEPTLGIDPEGVRELLAFIQQLNKERGITILLSSHQLHQVQKICDRVGIFVKGKLLAEGTMQELIRQLFSEETYVVQTKTSTVDALLIERLSQLDAVKRVEQIDSDELECYCSADISAEIAETIIQSGAKLYTINRKNFGLDEIYHRYFEGREANEQAKATS